MGARQGETSAGVDVTFVTSGHDVADARLHREVAALRRRGLTVEVLGLGDPAGGPEGALVHARPRAGGVRRAWTALRLPWRARGRVLVALDPDSTAGALLWRTARRLTRRPAALVADVHEDYALLLRDRAWARGLRGLGGAVWARLGDRAARRGDVVVVADSHLMADVPGTVVLRNLPDRSMLPTPSARETSPRALYVGDLRRSRGLFAMLDAVAAAPGWSLDLVGPIAAADRPAAERRMAEPDLTGRVRWHDRLPPHAAWAHARGAWAGLLLLEDTPAFRDAIPSKLYEYLCCGLAVVTTPLPRAAELVRASGAGEVVDGTAAAAEVLRAWADDPTRLDVARAAATDYAAGLAEDPTAEFADAVVRLVAQVSPA